MTRVVTEEQMMYAKGFEEALEHLHSTETAITTSTPTTLASLKNVTSLTTLVIPSVPAPSTFPPLSHTSLVMPDLPTEPVILPPSVLPSSRPSSGASGSYDGSDGYYHPTDGIKDEEVSDDGTSISGGESRPAGLRNPLSPVDLESQEKMKLERKRLRNRQAATKCRRRKLEKISHLDGRVQQLKEENGDLVAIVRRLKDNVARLKQEVMEHVNHGCEILTNEDMRF